MADNTILSTNVGTGDTVRDYQESGGSVKHPAGIVEYLTGGSAGAWTIAAVDITHGLPVQPMTGATWAATQSGAWNITNITGTVTLPTGAATAAKQPALGTAGTASADVITIQGIASMTAVKVDGSGVTQPVSGTVTANQGGAPWSVTVSNSVTVSGSVTADTELPAAAALADATANPTTPSVGADLCFFNGTTWDRARGDTTNGLWVNVKTQAALPAGTNVIGHVIVDSGTVTTVSTVTSLTQFNGNVIDTNSGNKSAGTLRVVLATDQPQLTNKLLVTPDAGATVQPITGTTGGATPFRYLAAASANQDSQVVKNSAGQLYNAIVCVNVNAAIRYLKIYDKSTSPTSADTPVQTIGVPGNTAGAGVVYPLADGLIFSSGISFRMTTGQADADASAVTAGDLALSLSYK